MRKVIRGSNLPVRNPLISTVVAYLFLDKIDAGEIVIGIAISFWCILWALYFYDIAHREYINIDNIK